MEVKKAKALRGMKAVRDGGEDFYDPDRKDNISGSVGRAPRSGIGQSFELTGES